MFTMLTSLSPKEVKILAETGKSYEINNIPQIHKELLDQVAKFMKNNVGFETTPVCCVSRMLGKEVSIQEYSELDNFLSVKGGTIILELSIRKDMCVSIEFGKLLRYNNEFELCEEFEREFLLEDFYADLKVGDNNGNSVVTFIPFLDIRNANCFAVVNSYWETEEMKVGDLPQYKGKKMNSF